jgi:putative transposase
MNQSQDLKTLYHCVYSLQYHLVLVTKYRRKCLNQEMRERLKELFFGLCQKWECELKECNGEEDHMHLLVSLTPKVTPSVFVNNLKTVSARMLRKEYEVELKSFYKERVLWSRTYCMVTCEGAPLSVLKRYIENQGVLS